MVLRTFMLRVSAVSGFCTSVFLVLFNEGVHCASDEVVGDSGVHHHVLVEDGANKLGNGIIGLEKLFDAVIVNGLSDDAPQRRCDAGHKAALGRYEFW